MQVELVKKATDDGLVEFEDDVPLGRKYLVDMESTRVILLLDDTTGGCHMKEIIYTVDGMWLPTECLKFVVH
jgi:hypothetical protein